MSNYLVLELGYASVAIELTPEVSAAIPAILSAKKVDYRSNGMYQFVSGKSDYRVVLAEVSPASSTEEN